MQSQTTLLKRFEEVAIQLCNHLTVDEEEFQKIIHFLAAWDDHLPQYNNNEPLFAEALFTMIDKVGDIPLFSKLSNTWSTVFYERFGINLLFVPKVAGNGSLSFNVADVRSQIFEYEYYDDSIVFEKETYYYSEVSQWLAKVTRNSLKFSEEGIRIAMLLSTQVGPEILPEVVDALGESLNDYVRSNYLGGNEAHFFLNLINKDIVGVSTPIADKIFEALPRFWGGTSDIFNEKLTTLPVADIRILQNRYRNVLKFKFPSMTNNRFNVYDDSYFVLESLAHLHSL